MNLTDINQIEYKKQLTYFYKSYGAEFRKGQGTEYILNMIKKFSNEGTLIDFGSGSNIYFWLIAFNQINYALCVDISKEAFYINECIRKKILYPKSCKFGLKKYKKNFDDIIKIKVNYKVYDILNKPFLKNIKYDNVTQFGLLGLCKNKREYLINLNKLLQSLNCNGVFLGANWCFSKKYSEKLGYNNSYLTKKLIIDYAKKNNYSILHLQIIPIKNDINYTYVLIYALRKKYDF